MRQIQWYFSRFINYGAVCATLAAFSLQAAPGITSVAKNQDSMGKYEKLELTVALTATYENPYDPIKLICRRNSRRPRAKSGKSTDSMARTNWQLLRAEWSGGGAG